MTCYFMLFAFLVVNGIIDVTQSSASCVTTGRACIQHCKGKADGDYQSCKGCGIYASCSNSILYDQRPCAPGDTRWDDRTKRCSRSSKTCSVNKCGCPFLGCKKSCRRGMMRMKDSNGCNTCACRHVTCKEKQCRKGLRCRMNSSGRRAMCVRECPVLKCGAPCRFGEKRARKKGCTKCKCIRGKKVTCKDLKCPAGHICTLSGKGLPMCRPSYINMCAVDNGGCKHICSTKATTGTRKCSCRIGFVLGSDRKTCTELCSKNNGGCDHICQVVHGSRKCSCVPDYQLEEDGKTCI